MRAYAGQIAANACAEWLRARYPLRARLTAQIRYACRHHRELALWLWCERVWLCGLAAWRDVRDPVDSDVLAAVRGRLAAPVPPVVSEAKRIVTALFAVLREVDGPCRLGEAVTVVADLLGIPERMNAGREWESAQRARGRSTARTDDETNAAPSVPPTIDRQLEQRDFLAHVWREVRALPIRQRVALLLNLRDDGQQDALTLITTAGVATHDELSACIGLSPVELTALLPDLPQDDLAIASRLGVTRRQVINLRKCARERLARRLGLLRGASRPGEGVVNRSDAADRLERLLRRDLDEAAREAGPPGPDEIDAYVAGRASAAEREVIESWLADDPALREEVDAVMAMRQAIEGEAGAAANPMPREASSPASTHHPSRAHVPRAIVASSEPHARQPGRRQPARQAARRASAAAGALHGDGAADARPAAPHRRAAGHRGLARVLHSLGRKSRPSAGRIRTRVRRLRIAEHRRARRRQGGTAAHARSGTAAPAEQRPPRRSRFATGAAKCRCWRTVSSADSTGSKHHTDRPCARARERPSRNHSQLDALASSASALRAPGDADSIRRRFAWSNRSPPPSARRVRRSNGPPFPAHRPIACASRMPRSIPSSRVRC